MPVYPGKPSKSKKSVDYFLEKEMARSKKARAGYSSVPRTRGPYSFGEMKYFDTLINNSSIVTSQNWANTELPPNVGTPNTLFCPTQGSAINQRIGRKVKLYKLRLRGVVSISIQTNQTVADMAPVMRFILVHDSQTNGTQAQGEDIMDNQSSTSNEMAVCAFQSLASLGRFRILKDVKIKCDPIQAVYDGTNIEQYGQTYQFEMNCIFKKPIEVSFNATNGGTISDIVDNSFGLYGITTNSSGVPVVWAACRAYYKE